MILTKSVRIKWLNSNVDYYTKLGYAFTKNRQEFEVKVEDLQRKCSAIVNVMCDECGENRSVPYYYLTDKRNRDHNCKSCTMKLVHKRKFENGEIQSFYEWCVENSRMDLIHRYDSVLNKLTPNEIIYSDNAEYYFKCENDKHPSELWNIRYITRDINYSTNCRRCNSFGVWCEENQPELLRRIDFEKINFNIYEIPKGTTSKIFLKCPDGLHESQSYEIRSISFNSNNCICSMCNSFAMWGINNISPTFIENFWDFDKTK